MTRDAILLLGGGFIGCALAARLAAQGRRVHLISRRPLQIAQAGLQTHVGDLADPALLEKMQEECSTVVHAASRSTPGSSARNPAEELENLTPLLELVSALQNWNDTHLVYVSSGGTVYGNPERNPVAEDAAIAPLSNYGAGKAAAETFLQTVRSPQLPITILRPANAYGPQQDLRQGFGLVRTVLQHIRSNSVFEIWGDGENVRDYVYIDDVVDAIALAAGADVDCGTYNVGSGHGHTVREVIAIAQRVSGLPLQVHVREARSTDVRAVVLDNARIRAALGWQPKTGLEEGIRRTWDWLKQS